MDEFWEEFEAERELIESTLAELEKALKENEPKPVVLAGMATFVHNFYNGVENILKKSLVAKGVTIDLRSPFWHHDLLKTAVDEKVISSELASTLKDYLGFRHFFVHGYGILTDAEKLQPLATNAPQVWKTFYSEILAKLKS